MSSAVIKLAAAFRIWVHETNPGERFDDERIYAEFIAPNEADILAALATFPKGKALNKLAERCIETLALEPSSDLNSALTTADAQVEVGSMQHSGPDVFFVVGAALSGLTIAALPFIILAARIRRLKRPDGTELTFFPGIPKETVELLDAAGKNTPRLENYLKQNAPKIENNPGE